MMDDCRNCRRHRPVPGDGPRPCKVMVIGEGPGQEEDARRRAFIGRSGKELNGQYLPMAGLSRFEDVYVTNAIKCRQGSDDGDKPSSEDISVCAAHHLTQEMRVVQPEYVVTLGAKALELFGEHSLEMVHGRPLEAQEFGPWAGTVFPIYHPAAGLHDSSFMVNIQQDFTALWKWRHNRLRVPVDPHPNPDYRELVTEKQVVDTIWAGGGNTRLSGRMGYDSYRYPGIEVAVDTETDQGRFWCLSFSLKPGTGYMLRSPQAVAAFRRWLGYVRPLVVYHNYLFDAPVLAQVDIVTPRFTDTMVEAYGLGGLVPLGLKALAWRECGMVMRDYEDVVLPYAMDQALEYLERASRLEIDSYVNALPWKPKIMKCSGAKKWGGKHTSVELLFTEPVGQWCYAPNCNRMVQPGKMVRDKMGRTFIWDKANTILNAVIDKGANPLKRWAKVPEEERAVMEAEIGVMPVPSIAQVPLEEAIPYACRDADATLRVKTAVRRRVAALTREVGRAA